MEKRGKSPVKPEIMSLLQSRILGPGFQNKFLGLSNQKDCEWADCRELDIMKKRLK